MNLKEKVKKMDRNTLIEGKPVGNIKKKNKNMDMAFLTGYNRQYKITESIIKKHWPILQSDKTLNSILPRKPSFIYRKAPPLRNKLVHNALDPPKQIKIIKNLKVFFKCGKCLPCKSSKKTNRKITTFRSANIGKEYNIKELITCNSTHVTYVLECPCHIQYVGRTTRQLHVRIRDHITNIKNGYHKHSVSRHFKYYHNKDPSCMVFYAIDKIKGHWRGENKKNQNLTK